MIPQLIVTITPDGKLAVELPGVQATRRQVVLRTAEAGESLLKMLNAQAADRTEIGLDGAPTAAQVKHWERHGTWPDSHCRFCIAEGRAKPDYERVRTKKKELVFKRSDGVEVRTIKLTESGKKKLSLTELELD
jgi:hypothetical protein